MNRVKTDTRFINPARVLNFFIALTWLANGLFCKVLNLVPRHEKIVEMILNTSYPGTWTFMIGLAETLMFIWVLSGFKRKLNAIVQICLILIMNLLEFFAVPDLLLWGRWNLVFAVLFSFVVYFNAFILLKRKQHSPAHEAVL